MYYHILGVTTDKRAVEYLSVVLGCGLIAICGLSLAVNSQWFF